MNLTPPASSTCTISMDFIHHHRRLTRSTRTGKWPLLLVALIQKEVWSNDILSTEHCVPREGQTDLFSHFSCPLLLNPCEWCLCTASASHKWPRKPPLLPLHHLLPNRESNTQHTHSEVHCKEEDSPLFLLASFSSNSNWEILWTTTGRRSETRTSSQLQPILSHRFSFPRRRGEGYKKSTTRVCRRRRRKECGGWRSRESSERRDWRQILLLNKWWLFDERIPKSLPITSGSLELKRQKD